MALLQSLGITFYCGLVGLLFWRGNEIFGKVPSYLGPVAFLVLFIVSGLVCGLIVFYRPYKLFFNDKKREAINLVVYTTAWLCLFFLVLLVTAAALQK